MDYYDSISQYWTDRLSPHVRGRWYATGILFLIYAIYILKSASHVLIAYCLAVYLIHGFILFATPKNEKIPDPFEFEEEIPEEQNVETVDYSGSNGRAFIRNLPEFKYWLFSTQLIAGSFFLSLFSFTDIPVYSPILIFYFIFMVIATAVRLWKHSKKYNYNPFGDYGAYFRE